MLVGIVAACAVLAVVLYSFWNWPAEHRVDHFFAAVEAKDFPKAFGIWNNDPGWQEHPQKYAAAVYPYGRFVTDWGPSSEYGVITSHTIDYATSRHGNSVLLAVEINGRKDALVTLAVGKKAHTLGFAPFDLTPIKNIFGWTFWELSYR